MGGEFSDYDGVEWEVARLDRYIRIRANDWLDDGAVRHMADVTIPAWDAWALARALLEAAGPEYAPAVGLVEKLAEVAGGAR